MLWPSAFCSHAVPFRGVRGSTNQHWADLTWSPNPPSYIRNQNVRAHAAHLTHYFPAPPRAPTHSCQQMCSNDPCRFIHDINHVPEDTRASRPGSRAYASFDRDSRDHRSGDRRSDRRDRDSDRGERSSRRAGERESRDAGSGGAGTATAGLTGDKADGGGGAGKADNRERPASTKEGGDDKRPRYR